MSSRTISHILRDSQIKAFINPNGQFLKLLNNNFRNTNYNKQLVDIKQKEYRWGIDKLKNCNIPMFGSLNYWSGPLGEYYVYSSLKSSGKSVKRPHPVNGFTPDWECDDYIYEVKTRNYTSTGSIGEKALGIPFKYCDIPDLYGKPLKIVLVGKLEYEGIYKFGVINNHNISFNKLNLLKIYKNMGIEFIGASQL